ncbi:MAG: hypothetical protein L0Y70_24385 [Gemmataceae bacterium]|nr:hypothetical protein [Gemmataceae bacterium]
METPDHDEEQGPPLNERFPEMTPVTKAPSLGTVNGVGTMVYGNRDYDVDTGTYVKTHVVCFLFIPLFSLGAYRVADAPEGWYFLGKVPLSALAKTWNFLVLLLIAGGVGLGFWLQHINSADYIAQTKMADADNLVAEGKFGAAANAYRQLGEGKSSHAPAAKQKLVELLENPALAKQPEEAWMVTRLCIDEAKAGRPVEKLFEKAQALAQSVGEDDPRKALQIVDAAAPFAADPKAYQEARLPFLKAWLKKSPNDLDAVTELAVYWESRRDIAECKKLLEPYAKELGQREGARILGQVYMQEGKFDEAYRLLSAYAETRLQQFQDAESNWRNMLVTSEKDIMNQLQRGTAPDFNRAQYDRADKATQMQMINDYVDGRLRENRQLRQALEEVQKLARVVPVALDLGLVLLQRAQAQPDVDARKKELEKAEKTFLAIHGVAGQTAEFKVHLGQVYYWLGKHAEGTKLWDEVLEKGRDTDALMRVSAAMRQVGETAKARTLTEEAYEKETVASRKMAVADMRAAMARDLDDSILWLERADLNNPPTKASWNNSKGQSAWQKGDETTAAQLYRDSIAIYEKQPESFVILNNRALSHLGLFRATGDKSALTKSTELLEKALSLKPEDSILLINTADQVSNLSLGEIIGPRIDLSLLREPGNVRLLMFLYHDQATWEPIRNQLREHPGLNKAINYYERLLLLAPKKAEAYASLHKLFQYAHNLEKMRSLEARLKGVAPDLTEHKKLTLEDYQGKHDDKLKKDLINMKPRVESQLRAARKVGGPTFAAAATTFIGFETGLDKLGVPANPDAMVELAQEVRKATPSRGASDLLMAALLFRAHRNLLKSEPAYAALAEKGRRSLHPNYLIAWALNKSGPQQKAILANPDVRQALDLLQEGLKLFPKRGDEWTWAMLRTAHPAAAEEAAKRYQKEELSRLEMAILREITPYSADYVVRQAWAYEIAGKSDEAAAFLKESAKRGVPLP